MNENENLVPKRRFKEFRNTGTWEQRKLGDMVEFFSGLTYSPDNVIKQPGTLVLRSSNVQNGEIVNADNVYVDNEVVNSDNVQVGDIAVVVRNGSRSLIGKHAAIKYPMKDTVIGAFMTGVRSDTPSFTNALLDTQQFETEIAKNLGATINQITTGNFKKMIFNFPEIDERLRIGDFFNQLDNTIALHQRKLEKSKALKSAYLSEMFPAEGERKPKRRFAGFTDDWEQRKLGEVANFLNGRAYKQQELLESGKYRVLRVGNFNTNDKWYYSDLELEENKYANSGDLLYLWATNFGPEIWDEEKVIYHYHIWKLDLYSSEVDKQYMYTWLITDKEKIKQTTNGTTMVHVTKGNMEQREFQLPISIKEQKKIGSFFKQLDNTIALHQHKLEKLQNIKQAYLNELFV